MAARVKVTVKKPRVNPGTILVNAFGTKANPGSVILEARKDCVKIAEEMAAELREEIYGQAAHLKLHPLSPAYLARKKALGKDTRILIATRKYVKAIGAIETPFGATVGLTRKTRKDGDRILEYAKLQRWLEFGTKRMRARPHWRVAMRYWKDNRGEYGLRLKGRIGRELRRKLRAG